LFGMAGVEVSRKTLTQPGPTQRVHVGGIGRCNLFQG
jgi:hypothetical protein